MAKPTDADLNAADLNAFDITDAEAAEINRIAHPLVADPAPDANDDLVRVQATPDGLVFVTLNRPQKKNAFDAATIAALHEAFETLHGADHVRAVFIRGAGDLQRRGRPGLDARRRRLERIREPRRRHGPGRDAQGPARRPGPDRGHRRGRGHGRRAGIVAACDMAVAVRGTRFAFSEVKLGLIPATIAPYVIEAVGARTARALFLTADVFDAEAAKRFGLIGHVLDDAGQIDAFVADFSAAVRACAPGAMGRPSGWCTMSPGVNWITA